MEKFIDSIKKNSKGILLIIFASLLTAIGQLLWKLSNGQELKYLVIGFMLYGIGAVVMIIAFRFGSLSVLHPMLSFGYVFAIFLGYFVLKESISIMSYAGILTIIFGVILIGGGDV